MLRKGLFTDGLNYLSLPFVDHVVNSVLYLFPPVIRPHYEVREAFVISLLLFPHFVGISVFETL